MPKTNYQSPSDVQIENEYEAIPNTGISAGRNDNNSNFYSKALLGIGAAAAMTAINKEREKKKKEEEESAEKESENNQNN